MAAEEDYATAHLGEKAEQELSEAVVPSWP
jgi:hypothetical protein